jgi:hypothetical protein
MTQKNTNIIPIRYMSGTGGQFLSNFITAAKNNNKKEIVLSPYGNAHENNLIDFFLPPNSVYGPRHSDSIKVEALTNLQSKDGATPIYYPAMHLMDIEGLITVFEKVISITYDKDDISDIALIFHGKFYIDELQYIKPSSHDYVTMKITLNNAYSLFKIYESINVLNVSWKELFHLDENIIIDKISSFTGIPKENFNISNLLKWRKATLHCLDTVSSTLNT